MLLMRAFHADCDIINAIAANVALHPCNLLSMYGRDLRTILPYVYLFASFNDQWRLPSIDRRNSHRYIRSLYISLTIPALQNPLSPPIIYLSRIAMLFLPIVDFLLVRGTS